jgi:tetratricopeptide (TPR) repeat protein
MIRRRGTWMALGLAAATLVFYAGVLDNAFVNYDDDLYITDRLEVDEGLTPESLAWAFTSTQAANWFPLTRLSWLLDAQLFGVEARGFHATSLALHVANALLLFWALVRLTGALGASAFVAGVFALHPLHVESVAWAAARKDALAGLFFMLALLAHERVARSRRPWPWGVALFACMALGLMAKPVLVTLPCVLLLLDAWPLGRLWREDGRLDRGRALRALLEKLPLFALAAASSAITLSTQDAGGALQDATRYPLWLRLANFCEATVMYVAQAFWPRNFSVFYPHPLASVEPWKVGLGAWLLLGVSWWALRRLRRRPWAAVGWLWFVGMLVPTSGIFQVGQASRADRYTYLPLIGLAIAVTWAVRAAVLRWPAVRVGVQRTAVVVLLLLGLLTADQVDVWRSSRSLFEHALAVTEHNHVAHINLGLALHVAGHSREAEPHLSQAIAIEPASAMARGIRGEVRLRLERYAEAEPDFRAALRLQPRSPRWSMGLAYTLLELDRAEEAGEVLRRARVADPDAVGLHAVLGMALLRSGRSEEGMAELRQALAREGQLSRELGRRGAALVHAQVGLLLADAGSHEQALAELGRAVALDPDTGEYHASRGVLLQTLGREAAAAQAYRQALERGTRSIRVLNNLAWLLAAGGDPELRAPDEALVLAQEAAGLTRDGDPSVLDTLATAYAAAGRPGEALAIARRALGLARAQQRGALAESILERFPALSGGDGPTDATGAGA